MTTLATEVTAIAANRHDLAVRTVVVHRFVTDRFHFDGRDNAIGQVIERAVAVYMRLAVAALAMAQATAPQAQIADHVAIFKRLLQLCFDELVVFGHRNVAS